MMMLRGKNTSRQKKDKKQQNRKRTIKLMVWGLLGLALGYMFIGSVRYLFVPEVPEEYKNAFQTKDFYADETGVDRAIAIDDAGERFETILRAIDNAKETLDVSYFFIKKSQTTSQVIGALLYAADRGVKVRVIVDGVKCGFTSEMGYALGSHENIEVAVYNPMNYAIPWKLHSRMHDKYIISDDKILVVGGGNIDEIYLCETIDPKKKVDDRMALVYNTAFTTDNRDSVLFQVRDYMNEMWNSDYVQISYEDSSKSDKQESFREEFTLLSKARGDELQADSFNYEEATLPTDKISFIHNPINVGVKMPTEEYAMIQLMESAKEEVVMETPYLIADRNMNELLENLGNSDRKCEVLCSSKAGVPPIDLFLFSVYLGGRKQLLKTNIDLYEHQSITYKHIKTYVIDQELTIIGSYNMCYHSYCINTDIMLVVDSPEFAEHVLASSEQNKEMSCLVGPNNRYVEGTTEPLPVPPLKNLLITMLEYPMQLFRHWF